MSGGTRGPGLSRSGSASTEVRVAHGVNIRKAPDRKGDVYSHLQ